MTSQARLEGGAGRRRTQLYVEDRRRQRTKHGEVSWPGTRNLSRVHGPPGLRGLTEAHLLAQHVDPAHRDRRHDLAPVEDEGVADRRGLRNAEEAHGEPGGR